MRECVCFVVLLLVLVAVIDVLDEDVLLAVEHDVAELVEEREPERVAVLETVVQLDDGDVLVPAGHAVNGCRLEVLRVEHLDSELCAQFLQLVHAVVNKIFAHLRLGQGLLAA